MSYQMSSKPKPDDPEAESIEPRGRIEKIIAAARKCRDVLALPVVVYTDAEITERQRLHDDAIAAIEPFLGNP